MMPPMTTIVASKGPSARRNVTRAIFISMARGWESKSVESQQADREARDKPATALSEEEAARLARQRTLELARTRALADLASATAPAHRRMLEEAIRALDEQLRNLDNRRMN
jgi:biopolymer transport protein ExbB/TolQ